jgi:Core-2/I-Branching enzyme
VTVAYVVLAYHKPDQLGRLVSALREEDPAGVWVHVDRRTPAPVFEAMRAAARPAEFVRRHPSPWGGIGHVLGSLEGLRAATRVDGWSHAVLLTGQDYPIRPRGEIAARLEAAGERSFMEHSPLPRAGAWEPERGGLDRIERRHLHARGRVIALPGRRRLPDWLRPSGGSGYWNLSRAAAEYALAAATPRVLRFFRWAKFPDELVYQSLLAASPLAETIESDSLRHIEWTPNRPNPDVLRADAIPRLRTSTALFARKFDLATDPDILDLLDVELRDR